MRDPYAYLRPQRSLLRRKRPRTILTRASRQAAALSLPAATPRRSALERERAWRVARPLTARHAEPPRLLGSRFTTFRATDAIAKSPLKRWTPRIAREATNCVSPFCALVSAHPVRRWSSRSDAEGKWSADDLAAALAAATAACARWRAAGAYLVRGYDESLPPSGEDNHPKYRREF